MPAGFLCPWDFPDKNTGVGCHFLLHGIFPTQGSNLSPALTGGFFTPEPARKPNLTIMRAQWAKGYVWTQEIPAFPRLSLSATQLSKMHGLLLMWRFLLSFVCLWAPLFTTCMISGHLVPAPISLLIPSYLPAITNPVIF